MIDRTWTWGLSAGAVVAVVLAACGGGKVGLSAHVGDEARKPTQVLGGDDQSRCDFRGRTDREVSETAGPGATLPNVRRVYQIVGTGDDRHKVLVCREVDTNLDGKKDVVRTYNEKGESLREEADSNYDGKVDTWITFASGRIAKEDLDVDFNGQPDTWKFYSSGQLTRIQRDVNRDGKADVWEFYVEGRLERSGVDVDGDGHVDRWDHDEIARAAAEAEAAKQSASPGAKVADAGAAPAAEVSDAGADGASGADDAGPKSKRLQQKREQVDGGTP